MKKVYFCPTTLHTWKTISATTDVKNNNILLTQKRLKETYSIKSLKEMHFRLSDLEYAGPDSKVHEVVFDILVYSAKGKDVERYHHAGAERKHCDSQRRAGRPRRIEDRVYGIMISSEEELKAIISKRKLAPQAQACARICLTLGKGQVNELQLRLAVEEHKDSLKTRQSPWRIFTYYQFKLKSVGILEYIN
jgi:hypothetical protein